MVNSRGFQAIARSAGRRPSNILALYSRYRLAASSARRRLNAPEGMTGQGPPGVLNMDEEGPPGPASPARLGWPGLMLGGVGISSAGRLSGLLGVESLSDISICSCNVSRGWRSEVVLQTDLPKAEGEEVALAGASSSLSLSISRLRCPTVVDRGSCMGSC